MTVASTLTTRQYTSTGVNTQFAFPNKIFSASDLVVTIFDLAGNSYPFTNFANAALGLTFSVQNVDVDTGCTVVLSAPFTINWTIDIRSLVADTQSTSIKNQGQFLPELHEEAFDRSTRQIQDLLRLTYTFGIHGPDTETVAWPALPVPSLRKGYGLMFDALTGLPGLGFLSAQNVTLGLLAPLLNLTQTVAEVTAGITPTTLGYAEGDIRRYGATTGLANNAPAILAAATVSAAGGRMAYIPPGVWSTTAAVLVPAKASMIGEGAISIIQPTTPVDGLQFALDPTPQPARRFIGRFAIISTNGGANSGISCTVQPSAAWSIDFQDIGIQNFQTAILESGFRACNFIGIAGMNNYGGISLLGQNTNNEIIGCSFIRGTITGAGGAYGIRIQQSGGNTTQSTQITDTYVFGYDMALKQDLGFETQVTSCDFSNCLIKAVEVTSTIGGFWLEDCWIEVINPAQTNGVDVANITPSTTAKVYINRNFLRATTAVAGTIGINLGNANAGAQVNDNHVLGFDKGINIGASNNVTCHGNTVNINTSVYSATSYGIQLNSSATDVQLGPNYIVPGTPAAVTMANASTSILVTPAGYPVGTPIQFDASQNGFFVGVTYYVVGVGGNFIQAGATPGGAAIAATGAVAVNVFQAPLPVVFTGSTPPPGFSFFARGSFLGSLGGFAANILGPVDWVANGYETTIDVRAATNFTGVSAATTMGLLNLPPMLYPLTTQQFMAYIQDNGIKAFGLATLTNTGVFSFFKDATGAAFTGAGNKSLFTWPMKYLYT